LLIIFFYVEDYADGDEIMVGAIKYLTNQAIPPLRGNYEWFHHSLATVLEICCPTINIAIENIPFLLKLQRGIIDSMENSISRKDDFPDEENDQDSGNDGNDPIDTQDDLPY
jgi:hypothetical protein